MVRVTGIVRGARPDRRPGWHFRTRPLTEAEADAVYRRLCEVASARRIWLSGQATCLWSGVVAPGDEPDLDGDVEHVLRSMAEVVPESIHWLARDRDPAG